MPRYVVIEKHVGETPLAAMEAWRLRANIPPEVPLAYAGRLDPMAEGSLLVLIGDECKQQTQYHALDKEYEFSVLLGVQTDSGDLLGMADVEQRVPSAPAAPVVRRATRNLRGRRTFPYPLFSSKTVRGKPLFLWTLENRLDEITLPTYESRVHALSFTGATDIAAAELLEHIKSKIALLPTTDESSKRLGSDWRRKEILARWDALLGKSNARFPVLSFRATVSAGTYIRSLAPLIAEHLGATGTVFALRRTRIGKFLPFGFGRGVWYRRY